MNIRIALAGNPNSGKTEVSEIRPAIRITCFLTITFLLLAASLLRRFTPS
jgi:hypothetical protein